MSFRLSEFRPKSTQEDDPPGVTPLWLVRSVNWIAWLFVAILVMTVFLRALDIARDKAVPLEVTHAGTWIGQLAFFFPLFAPLVLAAIALPWTAKVIIPAFCSFDWRNKRHRAPKVWCGVITVCVAVVTMTSGFPLYHGAYNERFKQEAVKLEQVDQRRASLEAEKQSIDEDLKALADSPNKYQAGAALAGAEAWKKRIAQAEADDDPQLGMIKKALSDAERGDQLRAERKKAIAAVSMAPTKAAALEQVKGAESYGSDAVVDFINAWWGFALFIVIEMCALVAGWIAYMMQMVRTQQLADYEAVHSEPVAEAGIDMRLEDFSNETQVRPQKYSTNERGEKMVWVHQGYYKDGTEKGHWRVLPSEKKRTQEEMDAAAAAKDVSERNPRKHWAVKQSMFDDLPADDQNQQVDDGGFDDAQEDQQADELSPETEVFAVEGSDGENGEGLAEGGERRIAPGTFEEITDATFEAPDEQAIRDEVSPPSELAQPEDAETRLPDGEGIVVWDDGPERTEDEITELERKWAARRGLPEPTEAAE